MMEIEGVTINWHLRVTRNWLNRFPRNLLRTMFYLIIIKESGSSGGNNNLFIFCEVALNNRDMKGYISVCGNRSGEWFSKLSVTSPTSQPILQPLRRFTYVTAHSPTLPLLHLRHSSLCKPSFASPTSQALHLRHLASRPWYAAIFRSII